MEQVWKLSTERLVLLEEENRHLRQNQANPNRLEELSQKRRPSDSTRESKMYSIDDEEEEEASELELHRCLYGIPSKSQKPRPPPPPPSTTRLTNSISTSSLSTATSANNLCDSLKLKSSKSSLQLHASSDSGNGSSVEVTGTTITGSECCDRCETLELQVNELMKSVAQSEEQLAEARERNFVLQKLNRCIEIENENFAYKVCGRELIDWCYNFTLASGSGKPNQSAGETNSGEGKQCWSSQ